MTRPIKLIALLALFVVMFGLVLPAGTVQAQSLKRWCKDLGDLAASEGKSCTIKSGAVVAVDNGDSLDVPPGMILVNNGTITNNGTIGTSGTINNNGIITNNNTINNNGTIINCGSISGNDVNGNQPEDCQ